MSTLWWSKPSRASYFVVVYSRMVFYFCHFYFVNKNWIFLGFFHLLLSIWFSWHLKCSNIVESNERWLKFDDISSVKFFFHILRITKYLKFPDIEFIYLSLTFCYDKVLFLECWRVAGVLILMSSNDGLFW